MTSLVTFKILLPELLNFTTADLLNTLIFAMITVKLELLELGLLMMRFSHVVANIDADVTWKEDHFIIMNPIISSDTQLPKRKKK